MELLFLLFFLFFINVVSKKDAVSINGTVFFVTNYHKFTSVGSIEAYYDKIILENKDNRQQLLNLISNKLDTLKKCRNHSTHSNTLLIDNIKYYKEHNNIIILSNRSFQNFCFTNNLTESNWYVYFDNNHNYYLGRPISLLGMNIVIIDDSNKTLNDDFIFIGNRNVGGFNGKLMNNFDNVSFDIFDCNYGIIYRKIMHIQRVLKWIKRKIKQAKH
jgi:hypothetical protein